MDDEKSGHRFLDTALLNYLSQLQVSYIISSQIDKTLTTLRLLQIVKSSARIGFRFFFNSWRIFGEFCCYLLIWPKSDLKTLKYQIKCFLCPPSYFTANYSLICFKFFSVRILAKGSKFITGILILKASSFTYSVIVYSESWIKSILPIFLNFYWV